MQSCASKPTPPPVSVLEKLPPIEPSPKYSDKLLSLLDQIQPKDLRLEIKQELVKYRMDVRAWEEKARGRMGQQ